MKKKIIRDLPEVVLVYLWRLEYNHFADEGEEKNIEIELNKFGFTLMDKSVIGEYNDLRGYLDFEIKPLEE